MISSFLIFQSVAVFVSLGLSLLLGHLNLWISVVSLISAMLAAWWFYQGPDFQWPKQKSIRIFLAVLSLACVWQFWNLVSVENGDYVIGNPNNFGDLVFHWQMIKGFAKGVDFWPQNLILYQERLRYAFAVDLFSALFESLQIPTIWHLVIYGSIAAVISVMMLYRWGGIWLLMSFFFSGGFIQWSHFLTGSDWGASSHLSWKNLFLAVFVTQRGMLYALPAGAFLLHRTWLWAIEGQRWLNKDWFAICLIAGALPFFHLHSAVIIFLLVLGLALIGGKIKELIKWLPVYGFLGLGFVLNAIINRQSGTSGIHVDWFWGLPKDKSIFAFIFYNFYLWLLIPISVFLVVRKIKWQRGIVVYLSILSFVFFNVMLAPWSWDQIKILLWIYLFWNFLFYKWKIFPMQAMPWSKKWVLAATLVFVPGFAQFVNGLAVHKYPIGNEAIVEEAKLLLKGISANDRIATAPTFNHPISYSGQPLVLGYEGHLWSHGYQVSEKIEKLDSLMLGRTNWQSIVKEIGARWVYWGENEIRRYKLTEPPWADKVPKRKFSSEATLYDMESFFK